jgi:hypothetical protein
MKNWEATGALQGDDRQTFSNWKNNRFWQSNASSAGYSMLVPFFSGETSFLMLA